MKQTIGFFTKLRQCAIDSVKRSVKQLQDSRYAICPENGEAWYTIGIYQQFGYNNESFNDVNGFPRDFDFVCCLKNASDCNHIIACYDLVNLYMRGYMFGVNQDMDLAEQFCDKGLRIAESKRIQNVEMMDKEEMYVRMLEAHKTRVIPAVKQLLEK